MHYGERPNQQLLVHSGFVPAAPNPHDYFTLMLAVGAVRSHPPPSRPPSARSPAARPIRWAKQRRSCSQRWGCRRAALLRSSGPASRTRSSMPLCASTR